MCIFTVGSEAGIQVVTAISAGIFSPLLMLLVVVAFLIICYCYYKRRTNKKSPNVQTQKRYSNCVANLSYYYKVKLKLYVEEKNTFDIIILVLC